MNIVQITPGAGGMFCGNCFRDNALVAALRQLGHTTLMVPLYLPMTLDEEDQSAGTPIFFSGINVYLEQKSALFRRAPAWLHRWLASPKLLQWAAGRAAKTRAADTGEIACSMLRGEEGHQARELEQFIAWLRGQPRPDVICLSNALLVGMVRRLRSELGVPVVCMLQGEDSFLDALPGEWRRRTWQLLAERAAEVDLFIAPSRYFGELMAKRLGLAPERVRVVHNGINLEGYGGTRSSVPGGQSLATGLNTEHWALNTPAVPTLGFFARMCREKGLDTLVEAFIELRRRPRTKNLKLRIGGGCGPVDKPFVDQLRAHLQTAGVLDDAEFCPNLDRPAKLEFLRSLTVFSVPALYGEAFGLYLIEAMAAGVPVVQPRHAAFPELIEATGGGAVCDPGDPKKLADALELVLTDPIYRSALVAAGRKAVRAEFSVERMAGKMVTLFEEVRAGGAAAKSEVSSLKSNT